MLQSQSLIRSLVQQATSHAATTLPKVVNPHRYYSAEVNDHFERPRNIGSIPEGKGVGTAVVGKASCGDVIKLGVKVNSEGIITDAKFKAFGCGSAIASSSYVTELIIGKTVNEAMRLKNTDVANALSLPPVKIHCSLLAEDAVKRAIENLMKTDQQEKSSPMEQMAT